MQSETFTAPLLPGIKPVLELLQTNPEKIDLVFCKKGLRSRELLEIQACCRTAGVRYSLVEQAALDRLCRNTDGHRHSGSSMQATAHQGVVARLIETHGMSLEELLQQASSAPLPLVIALDQVQDPGNVGTLCRTLYALGAAGMIMPRHNSAYLGPAAQRASAGALTQLPIARVTNLAHALDSAEEAGFMIYGTDGTANALNIFEESVQLPAILVLGNEEKGLRPGVAKRCSQMIKIPMARKFDSLNVAQAGGIITALVAQRIFS